MSYRGDCEFSELLGKTLASIEGAEANSGEITFTLSDGSIYRMLHEQDCCESVGVVDVIGDVADLIGLPLVLAEESTSGEDPEGYTDETERESFTWTFYRIASPKGHVDIRWLGESNGYYGEGVSFCRLRGPTPPEARCWCAAGAVVRVSLTGHHSESTAVFDALRSQIKGWSGAYNAGVSDYNDAHTHAEVLAMFDRAIEATKS